MLMRLVAFYVGVQRPFGDYEVGWHHERSVYYISWVATASLTS